MILITDRIVSVDPVSFLLVDIFIIEIISKHKDKKIIIIEFIVNNLVLLYFADSNRKCPNIYKSIYINKYVYT